MTARDVPVEDGARVEVAGLAFHALDEQQVIDHVLTSLDRGRGGWLVNPNIDVLRQVAADPDAAATARRADLVVADGVPILWLARLWRRRLPAAVMGSDLIASLSVAAHARGHRVFLLGASDGVGARAARRMHEGLGISPPDVHAPPFGFERDPVEQQRTVDVLRASDARIVFCGFGFPKQERLMEQLLPQFPDRWFIGTGASITFMAGEVSRAPSWLRGSGFEWVYRLAVEPRRLFKRYVLLDLPFAVRLVLQALSSRHRA